MTLALLAQAVDQMVARYAVAAVIILAVLGILLIAASKFGVAIPQWLWQVLGIVFAAVVCIVAIKFVAGL